MLAFVSAVIFSFCLCGGQLELYIDFAYNFVLTYIYVCLDSM